MGFLKKLFSKQPKINPVPDVDYRKIWDELQSTIKPLAKPCIRLIKTSDVKNSQIGGKPRVNIESFEWPYVDNKPMAFIAQLDLAELMPEFSIDWLPNTGSLLFFYEMDDMVWGFDPKDKGHWKVIYESKALTEIGFPKDLDKDYQLQHSFLSPMRISILPAYDSEAVEALNFSDEQFDAYIEYKNSYDEHNPQHQIGGFPSPVQSNGMELESQLASNGVNCGSPEGYEDPRVKALKAGAKDWRLLLQVDTDDDLELMWGDGGMLYFWIREQDAKTFNFDASWLILQCY